jgi:hypothetical protein
LVGSPEVDIFDLVAGDASTGDGLLNDQSGEVVGSLAG